jgi:hypothetical protein
MQSFDLHLAANGTKEFKNSCFNDQVVHIKKLTNKITAISTRLFSFIVISSNGGSSEEHTTWTNYGENPDQAKYFVNVWSGISSNPERGDVVMM